MNVYIYILGFIIRAFPNSSSIYIGLSLKIFQIKIIYFCFQRKHILYTRNRESSAPKGNPVLFYILLNWVQTRKTCSFRLHSKIAFIFLYSKGQKEACCSSAHLITVSPCSGTQLTPGERGQLFSFCFSWFLSSPGLPCRSLTQISIMPRIKLALFIWTNKWMEPVIFIGLVWKETKLISTDLKLGPKPSSLSLLVIWAITMNPCIKS